MIEKYPSTKIVVLLFGAIILIGILGLIGISEDLERETADGVPLSESVTTLQYNYDSGGEVICYKFQKQTGGGVSCIPVNQTAYNVSDFQ